MSTLPSKPDPDFAAQSEEFQPSPRALVSAGIAVAATYLYFLIFAQFGFLKVAQTVAGGDGAFVRSLMAVMAGCGIAGGIAVGKIFAVQRGRSLLLVGFGLGGAAAGLSVIAATRVGLIACAALTGAGTGVVTVALAALLRREVGDKKLGTCIGAGTGLAYGLCNLPPIFNASATVQAGVGMAACVVGGLAAWSFAQRAPQGETHGFEYRPGAVGGWLVIFFALVWLDSAAFYAIQHTPELKGGTWSGDGQLYLNAIVHAAAAVLAGTLLDRSWIGRTVLAAAGLLVAACLLIGAGPGTFSTGAFCYTAGVSGYSTALVFYVSRSGRVGVAVWVYSLAGWVGSALGIAAAERFGLVSPWYPGAAAVVILGGFLGLNLIRRRDQRARSGGGGTRQES